MEITLDIFKVGRKGDTYVPSSETSYKSQDRLAYFVYGKGWKTTKVYEKKTTHFIINNMLDIAAYASTYGIAIAEKLVERYQGCCTISARHRAACWKSFYEKQVVTLGKDFSDVPNEIIDIIPFDIFGFLDICELDERLTKLDSDYDNVNCTYKGKENVSMSDYVSEKYGQPASDFIQAFFC